MITRLLILLHCIFIANFNTCSQDIDLHNYPSFEACEELILRAHRPEPGDLDHCISVLETSDNYCASKPWVLLIGRGRSSLYQSDYQQALRLLEEVLPFLSRLGSDKYCFYLYYSSALNFCGKMDQSIALLTDGIKEALAKKDSTKLGELYSNLGASHTFTSHLDSGIFYYREAMKIAKLTNDKKTEAIVSLNFGTLYCDMDLTAKAKIFYNNALHLASSAGYRSVQEMALSNIGFVLYLEGKYDSSITILKRLQKLLLTPETGEVKDVTSYAYTLMLLGNNYIKLNDMEKAERYLLDARNYFLRTGHQIGIAAIYSSLNSFYLENKNYEESIAFGDSLLHLCERTELQTGLGLLYHNLAKAYEAKGDFKKASFFHNLRTQYDAEAYDKEKIISLESATLASDMIDKERELVEAQSKLTFLEKHKKALLAVLISVLLLLVLILYAYRRSSRFNKNLLITNQEKERYILKQAHKLQDQKQKLLELQTEKEIPLALPNGKCIQADDILYIKSEGHYLLVKMSNGPKHIFRGSLIKFQTQLPAASFMRVHYSYIINLSHISSTRYREIVLSNEEVIKIGPTYLNQFREAFLLNAE